MSQHIYSTVCLDRPVSVLVGWDRPLQGFFMVVEFEDSQDDEYAYCNLEDLDLLEFSGLPPTFDFFAEKLQLLGIKLPELIVQELEMDRRSNAGNRRVVYDMNGEVKSDTLKAMA